MGCVQPYDEKVQEVTSRTYSFTIGFPLSKRLFEKVKRLS